MKAALLKRLFSAVQSGASRDVMSVCKHIVEDERRLGHTSLAEDLQRSIDAAEKKLGNLKKDVSSSHLVSLPSSKRDSAPLVQVLEHEKLRHHMVLSQEVEQRFIRIGKEYAARARLATYGLRARKRILFYGPPGCGKSLGAERLAWSVGLPLYKVRFDTLISSFFGETALNLWRVFDAVQQKPCALFLDECDTIARSRGENNDVGEVSRVVNMLLQLLEDYHADGLVIAATNNYEALDKAIYRRFDEALEMPKPGTHEIARMLKRTLLSLDVEKEVSLDLFSESLDGLSYCEVERIAQNAAKCCVMSNRTIISLSDLQVASQEVKRHS